MKKENGQLVFYHNGGFQFRNPSTIWCITEADKIYKWGDFPEMTISTEDSECNDSTSYSYSRMDGNLSRVVPDFVFHNWPQSGIQDYEMTINKIQEAGLKKPLVQKLGWIGNINTNPMRERLLHIGNNHRDIMDIRSMTWFQEKDANGRLKSTHFMSLEDLVHTYAMLIDVEGHGYSGRLKCLLWSRRPLLLVERPHHEYFFEHLKAWEHYIPVKRDLSDLVEKVRWTLDHQEEALCIARNALEFSKQHLTRAACFAIWNRIIKKKMNRA